MRQNTTNRFRFGALAFVFLAFAAMAQDDLPPASSSNTIRALGVVRQADTSVIKVELSEEPASPPSYFSIASPPRVVFDFPGVSNGLNRTMQSVNEGGLNSINIVQVGDRTRMIFNLKRAGTVETSSEGKVLRISLKPTKSDNGAAPGAAQQFLETAGGATDHAIRDINFRRGKNGEGLITIEMSDANTGINLRQEGSKLVADFSKASLPEQLRRRLDVTDFGTPVTSVSTVTQGEDVRMIITPQGLWEHTAYQADNQFVIEVKALKEDPSKIFQGSQRQGYQGEKVSLNFQNIPLRELLHVFADITNFNIVVSDTVAGSVSLRLNDVPWDQALDIVFQQKGLDMRKNGNVILIAPRDELAAKEKQQLESQQQLSDLEPMRTETFQLNYQKAEDVQKLLTDKSQTLLSKRGTVIADTRTNKVFVNDAASRLDEVRRFIAEIDVAMRQVLIEARIVYADSTFSKALGARLGGNDLYGLTTGHTLFGGSGTRWGIAGSQQVTNTIASQTNVVSQRTSSITGQPSYLSPYVDSNCILGYLTGTSSPYTCTYGASAPTQSSYNFVNLPVANAGGSFAFSLMNSDKTEILTLEVTANEADGKLKTVSSPRILTADQVEAEIRQGTRVPYQQATSSGATATVYIDAVMQLKVKPQITADGKVKMSLQINKDELGTQTAFGYTILTKHVQTDVVVENGGTIVIGGIYEQSTATSVQKVPVLGDLPVVGFAFRNNSKSEEKTELLIFITPKIVSEKVAVR